MPLAPAAWAFLEAGSDRSGHDVPGRGPLPGADESGTNYAVEMVEPRSRGHSGALPAPCASLVRVGGPITSKPLRRGAAIATSHLLRRPRDRFQRACRLGANAPGQSRPALVNARRDPPRRCRSTARRFTRVASAPRCAFDVLADSASAGRRDGAVARNCASHARPPRCPRRESRVQADRAAFRAPRVALQARPIPRLPSRPPSSPK